MTIIDRTDLKGEPSTKWQTRSVNSIDSRKLTQNVYPDLAKLGSSYFGFLQEHPWEIIFRLFSLEEKVVFMIFPLISFFPLFQVDPHRDRLGGLLVREAGPARHLPQSGKDSRLDIALGELPIVMQRSPDVR